MTSIVWLASYPRSGNTWTRAFLAHLMDQTEGVAPNGINGLCRRTTYETWRHWWTPFLGKEPIEASHEEVATKRMDVQKAIAGHADGRMFVKTHNALMKTCGHAPINMDVTWGAIYVVRNPLDVAVSMAPHFGIGQDDAIGMLCAPCFETPNLKDAVYEVYGSWREHAMTWTDTQSPGLFVVRYEDLVLAPHEQFTRLARHLRIEATDEQVDKSIAACSFDNLSQQERERGFVEANKDSKQAFFRKGQIGGWRDSLSAEQIATIVACQRDMMEVFGYVDERGAPCLH